MDCTQAPLRTKEEIDSAAVHKGSSSKIDQLVHLLRIIPGTEKSLVFSQFTSFLDKVKAFHLSVFKYGLTIITDWRSARRRRVCDSGQHMPHLTYAFSISYMRFDGQMSAKRRQETIAQFMAPGDGHNPKVMLLSLKAVCEICEILVYSC